MRENIKLIQETKFTDSEICTTIKNKMRLVASYLLSTEKEEEGEEKITPEGLKEYVEVNLTTLIEKYGRGIHEIIKECDETIKELKKDPGFMEYINKQLNS